MSIAIEYSRLVFKRSALSGVVPTIPTATTIDNTWLPTDLLAGEAFINLADDRFWFRTDNGIIEVDLSGSSLNTITTGATLVGNTIYFETPSSASAYTVDLSSIVSTGGTISGNYLPLTITGNTTVDVKDNSLYFTGNTGTSIIHSVLVGSSNNIKQGSAVSSNGSLFVSQDSLTLDNFHTGADQRNGAYLEYNTGLTVTILKVNKSSIRAQSEDVSFPGITYDIDYSANYTNRSLVDKEYVDGLATTGSYLPLSGGTLTGSLTATSLVITSVGGGTPIINLGLDSSGNVVTGTTGGGGSFLPLTGGTLTGPLVVNSTLRVTGNTIVNELSATTLTLLNSGSTTRNYTDYSSNLIRTGVTNSTIAAGSGNTINANLRNVFVAGANLTATTNDTAYFSNVVTTALQSSTATISGTLSAATIFAGGVSANAGDLSFAISDETTAITSGTSKLTFYAPYAFTITKVIATLSTSGSSLSEFDVNLNGTTIFSKRPTIDANEFHSDDAASGLPSYSTTSVAYKDRITVDIDQAGTGAKGAKVYILLTRNS